jgi:diguanylate cyclase (GGDEF)-like protein/PAS domain S-box-containing protein
MGRGQVLAWYGALEDIHDQVAAELALRESEERYRLASRATSDVIWDWSIATDRVTWGGAVSEVLGEASGGETSLDWWSSRIHPQDRVRVHDSIARATAGDGDLWESEYRFQHARGGYVFIYAHGFILRDGTGRATRMVGSMIDVTARKTFEEELRWAAYHDPLTRLPNRAAYAERLDEAIARARADGGCVGLIIADLNNFKSLNDNLGHDAGDALLRQIADRLVRGAPSGATVARLGGDEFAVILPGISEEDANAGTVHAVLSELKAPFLVEGMRVDVSLCAGAALWPRDAQSVADLLRCADLALYAAKADLPGTVRGFRPEMREKSEERRRMLEAARAALRDDRIVPFYQPKVCLRTGQVAGFEALLRWHDHRHGLQPPSALSAAFEDVELAVQITDRMLDTVVRDCAGWRRDVLTFGRVALNVSSADFRRTDLATRILGKLEAAGLPPTCLEVEVTESVFLGQNAGVVAGELMRLREAGVTIALDDFGTGYASLTHLQQFPVSVLKIDRTFVTDIDSQRSAIVDALLNMARSLQIVAVAEGVERPEQAAYLRSHGCDLAQGYLFSRPIPALRVPGLLASWPPEPRALADASLP